MKIKATYIGIGGYPWDREVSDKLLTKRETYTVTDVQMGKWRTEIKLEGFDKSFNAILFTFNNEEAFQKAAEASFIESYGY
tara:strand:- start:7336 stop:7578 length:243 start_codon:yes stop_codon:yes gene_type:complete